MAKKTDAEKQKEKELKQAEKQKEKELKQQEKINKLEEKKQFKYKNIEEIKTDLNNRLKIALQNGYDPLGILSITQIYEDIQTVNKLSNVDIEEYIE